MTGPTTEIARLFDALATALAERVAQKLEERNEGLISQRHRKSLGPRRHPEAVRRRIAEGLGGAYRMGRDFLLTPEALAEERARYGACGSLDDGEPPPAPAARRKKAAAPANAEAATLLDELDRELAEAGVATTNRADRKPRK